MQGSRVAIGRQELRGIRGKARERGLDGLSWVSGLGGAGLVRSGRERVAALGAGSGRAGQ